MDVKLWFVKLILSENCFENFYDSDHIFIGQPLPVCYLAFSFNSFLKVRSAVGCVFHCLKCQITPTRNQVHKFVCNLSPVYLLLFTDFLSNFPFACLDEYFFFQVKFIKKFSNVVKELIFIKNCLSFTCYQKAKATQYAINFVWRCFSSFQSLLSATFSRGRLISGNFISYFLIRGFLFNSFTPLGSNMT